MIDFSSTPFIHPARPRPRFRPFKALRHFRNLIRNKEDTSQVFHIFESLPRRDFLGWARSFIDGPVGRARMLSEPSLPAILDDHASLKALPEGTVGRAYVDFMVREGLSAAGLVAEYERMTAGRTRHVDQIEWFISRLRDTHDLQHILTGYGRDALGEQCVLAYTYGQQPALGHLLIAWAGAWEIRKSTRAKADVFGAVAQAQRMGKGAQRLIDQDIRALLAEPLEAARARLGITPPTAYYRAHAQFRLAGIDPYDLLGTGAGVGEEANAASAAPPATVELKVAA